MTTLAQLRPTEKCRVMDLVAEAGHDISDWAASMGDPSQAAKNPKYCYEWAFLQSGQDAILSLWHDHMVEENGQISTSDSMLELIEKYGTEGRRSMNRLRATRFDETLKKVWASNIPVRVIINVGKLGTAEDPGSPASKVEHRELDPVAWTLTAYNKESGRFTLTRGVHDMEPGDQLSRSDQPSGKVAPPKIDPFLFEKYFDAFKAFVEAQSGVPFVTFASHPYVDAEEGYKYHVHVEGRKQLDCGAWKEADIGTGRILKRVINAVEIPDSNLVAWQSRYGDDSRPHHPLYVAQEDPAERRRVEEILFALYRSDRDAPSFDALLDVLGRKYPLMAYLMFLKDRSRYLPIAPTTFDDAFEMLGADFKTSHHCSWENYKTFLRLLSEVKTLLAEAMDDEVSLLDAHSFVWIIARQVKTTPTPPAVTEYQALGPTERQAIVMARIGQGRFREALLEYWQTCAVTGLREPGLLVASHIRPWRDADIRGRTDVYNGLLLSPGLDACFDRGLISFDDDGAVLISGDLHPEDAAVLGITSALRLRRIEDGHRTQLEYHRSEIFKKLGSH